MSAKLPDDVRTLQHQCARSAAQMRLALYEVVPVQRLKGIIHKLATMAEGGNIPAMRLLLSYTAGKPPAAPTVEPTDEEHQTINTQPATTGTNQQQPAVSKREQRQPSPRPLAGPMTLDGICAALAEHPHQSAMGRRKD